RAPSGQRRARQPEKRAAPRDRAGRDARADHLFRAGCLFGDGCDDGAALPGVVTEGLAAALPLGLFLAGVGGTGGALPPSPTLGRDGSESWLSAGAFGSTPLRGDILTGPPSMLPRMIGRPPLPPPTTTTLALLERASSSVASMPFQRR